MEKQEADDGVQCGLLHHSAVLILLSHARSPHTKSPAIYNGTQRYKCPSLETKREHTIVGYDVWAGYDIIFGPGTRGIMSVHLTCWELRAVSCLQDLNQ